jgi:pimeloyl-ACP methyl ester carboxylesterase
MVVTLTTGERLHYLEWEGEPETRPVVLVHDVMRTAFTWLPVGRRLAPACAVVAVDLRGHGSSDAPREGYDLDSLALDVLTVVAGQGWGPAVDGPPVVVAGHGFGALVAAKMAALQPDAVAGLCLVDGGWEEIAEATRMSPPELLAAMAEPPEALASMEAWLADRRGFDPGSWDADQERAARAQVEEKHAGHVAPVTRPSVVRRLVDAMYAYRPLEVLAPLGCPIVVLAAVARSADDEEERERWLALEDLRRARRGGGLPPVQVVRFEGVGHDLVRYRPDEVSRALAELAGLSPPGGGSPTSAPSVDQAS